MDTLADDTRRVSEGFPPDSRRRGYTALGLAFLMLLQLAMGLGTEPSEDLGPPTIALETHGTVIEGGNGSWMWSESLGTVAHDWGYKIDTDRFGNVFVGGVYGGSLTIHGVELPETSQYSIFVLKLDPSGYPLWVQTDDCCEQATQPAYLEDMKVDQSGNVFVAGYFVYHIVVDGEIHGSSSYGYEGFVGKIEHSGRWSWFKTIGGNSDDQKAEEVAFADDGSVYVAGMYASGVVFDDNLSISSWDSGSSDLFIAKLDREGNWEWANRVHSNGAIYSGGMEASPSGGVVFSGEWRNNNLYFGSGSVNLTSPWGSAGIFVAKANDSGAWEWAVEGDCSAVDQGRDITVDSEGRIYVTGYVARNPGDSSSCQMGDLDWRPTHSSSGFLGRLSPEGEWQWVSEMESESNSIYGYSVDVGPQMEVVVSGGYHNGNDLTIGDFTFAGVSSSSSHDVFVARANSSGSWLWADTMGGTGYDYSEGVAIDDFGNVMVTGFFDSSVIDIGSGNLTNVANYDAFFAKFGVGFDYGVMEPGFQEGSIFTDTTISAGNSHTCVILEGDSLHCWGRGLFGSLGTNSTDMDNVSSESEVNFPLLRHPVEVAAGGYHTCAILDDGSVSCWGWNNRGQTGVDSFDWENTGGDGQAISTNVQVPTPVDLGNHTAVEITAGYKHTCAILDDGSPVCWGDNSHGQLGDGLGGDPSEPDVWEMNMSYVSVPEGRKAIAIEAGSDHTCAILDDRRLVCWGMGNAGRLGDGGHEEDRYTPFEVPLGEGRQAVAVSAGGGHTCAILDDGSMSCWGNNGGGQLGRGTWGQPGDPGLVDLPEGRSAIAVSTGGGWTCAILDDGRAYCWGWNNDAQIGNGHEGGPTGAGQTANRVTVPEQPGLPEGSETVALAMGQGSGHSCAVLSDGSVYCWGDNEFGTLGLGYSSTSGFLTVATPHHVDTLGSHLELSERDLDGDGAINLFDDAGLGGQSGSHHAGSNIGGGNLHTCVRAENGSVYCWGSNSDGRLGIGSTSTSWFGPVAVSFEAIGDDVKTHSISVGQSHSCAILDYSTATNLTVNPVNESSSVACWGANNDGEVGSSPWDENIWTPVIPHTEPGDAVIAVDAGYDHTCVILESGPVQCWGSNSAGQLGTGEFTQTELLPVFVGQLNGSGATAIASGSYHTCAIVNDGLVECWGGNSNHQAGQEDQGSDYNNPESVDLIDGAKAIAIDSGALFTCVLVENGSVQCWGYISPLGLGDGANTPEPTIAWYMPGMRAISISTGHDHACALLENGLTRCWGAGDKSGAGFSANTGHSGFVYNTEGFDPIEVVAASGGHTCSITRNGSVYCWGEQEMGEVTAEGGSNDHHTPILVTEFSAVGVADHSSVDSDSDGWSDHIESFPGNPTRAIHCEAGEFGRYTCTDASPGHFSNPGAMHHTPCPTGAYQPNSGQPGCLAADIGSYVDQIAQTSQTDCGTLLSTIGFSSSSFEDCLLDTDDDEEPDEIDNDDDGDGVQDGDDGCPLDASGVVDSDGDGYCDNSDAFPSDPDEWLDSDGNGVGDNEDAQSDISCDSFLQIESHSIPNSQSSEYNTFEVINTGNASWNVSVSASATAWIQFIAPWPDSVSLSGAGGGNDTASFVFYVTPPAGEANPEEENYIGITALTDTGEYVCESILIVTVVYDEDSDGDGVADLYDAFPDDENETTDTDGDGVGDNADDFPNDANETTDTDGDGVGDNSDEDADGDGVPDDSGEGNGTADTDGEIHFWYPVFMQDLVVGDEMTPMTPVIQDPEDCMSWSVSPALPPGISLNESTGVIQGVPTDSFTSEVDGDGTVGLSHTVTATGSTCGLECLLAPCKLWEQDFQIDFVIDKDSDGDGVLDSMDAFPSNPYESQDADGDGTGNNADADDDGDGWTDSSEVFCGTDPLDGSDVPEDLDGDLICDAADSDKDGDGYDDSSDEFPYDGSRWEAESSDPIEFGRSQIIAFLAMIVLGFSITLLISRNRVVTFQGKVFLENGDEYHGECFGEDSMPHGFGTYYHQSESPIKGDRYEGDHVFGERTGEGSYYFLVQNQNRGNVYHGSFVHDDTLLPSKCIQGKGRLDYHNGNVYEGDFLDGLPHGNGEFYHQAENEWKGDRYEGEFTEGVMDGRGTYFYSDGRILHGIFEDGKLSQEISSEAAIESAVETFAEESASYDEGDMGEESQESARSKQSSPFTRTVGEARIDVFNTEQVEGLPRSAYREKWATLVTDEDRQMVLSVHATKSEAVGALLEHERFLMSRQEAPARHELSLGDFRKGSLISEGGMARVFRATEISTGRTCAWKEAVSSRFNPLSEVNSRLLDEGSALRALDHHRIPSFVAEGGVTNSLGEDVGVLLMEYIDVPALKDELGYLFRRGMTDSIDSAVETILQICDTLEYMADQDPPMYHRDVKPANIMVDPNRGAILIDFGLAKGVSAGTDVSLSRGLSEGWSPPERRDGVSGGFTDVFSLGQVLWHMLTGERPFHALSEEEISEKLVEKGHPEWVAGLIHSSAQRRDRRIQTVAEFRMRLENEGEMA